MQITITEALQEIKTIVSRIEKKRKNLGLYIARDARVRDPFEASGGSAKYVKEERQSILDLEIRIIKVRTEIQKSNLTKQLTVGDQTKTVSEWLTWRREISSGQQAFTNQVAVGLKKMREDTQKKGGKVTALANAEVNFDANAPADLIVNLDERDILKEADYLEQTLGALDGKLSLFNATTTIDI